MLYVIYVLLQCFHLCFTWCTQLHNCILQTHPLAFCVYTLLVISKRDGGKCTSGWVGGGLHSHDARSQDWTLSSSRGWVQTLASQGGILGLHMQAAIRTPALCAHPASYKEQLCYANIASACSLYYVRILLPCSTIWSSNLNGEKIVETNCSVTYSGLFWNP